MRNLHLRIENFMADSTMDNEDSIMIHIWDHPR